MIPCLAQKPDLINGFEFFMNHGAPCFTNMTRAFWWGNWEEQDYERCFKATDGLSYNFTSCITAFNH